MASPRYELHALTFKSNLICVCTSSRFAHTPIDFLKNANIVSVKVFDGSGKTTLSKIIAGNDFIAERKTANPNRPMVCNMSFGGPPRDTLESAITTAYDLGVVFVASAGNNYDLACDYTP